MGPVSDSKPDSCPAGPASTRRYSRSVMSRTSAILLWLPRVGGIAIALFLGLFAFDAFEGHAGFGERALALTMHLLPNFACLGLVAVAWKRPWVGALGFGTLALGYAVLAHEHLDWVALIAGPLALVAVLYVVSAARAR